MKRIDVYGEDSSDVPLVVMNSYEGDGRSVYDLVRTMTDDEFRLMNISGLDWDHDMSPWDAPPMFGGRDPFTAGADDHIEWILDEAIPAHVCTDPEIIIAGYSMAGMFAVYSVYRTDRFSKVVSVSGSLWFPDLMEFISSHRPKRIPEKAYVSLGDRESRTRNPVLSKVEECSRKVEESFRMMGSETLFELNPGNHFQDPDKRMAKGIAWALRRSQEPVQTGADDLLAVAHRLPIYVHKIHLLALAAVVASVADHSVGALHASVQVEYRLE